jgi:hypothetical protein
MGRPRGSTKEALRTALLDRFCSMPPEVHFNEVVKGTAGPAHDVEIPEKFTVSIPVYIGSPKVDLTARLRYRLASGKLTLWYDLYRAAAVERAPFASVRDIVAAATETVVLNGVPA